MSVLFPNEEFKELKKELVVYKCALSNMEMRVNVLLEEYMNLHSYNPIEHVKARIKSPERIAEKLKRRGFPITAKSARQNLTDIAGIRCICSFANDIETLAEVIIRQPDIKILKKRDYIKNPKETGYRSYHMIVEVPVYMTDATEQLPVEVQIRTQAMDFWASLEHKVLYRFNDDMPETLNAELKACADEIAKLDKRMHKVQDIANLTRK